MPTIKRKDVHDKYMSALTLEDRDIIRLKVEILREIVKNRKEQGMTQKELGESTGFAQAFIARIENFKSNPQLDTVLKLLRSLGKTLAVVPISYVGKDGMVVAEHEIDSTVEHR
ncbi:MAG: helix-turn-helix transcriptional regulator [Thermoguttaceae bacterium]|nr:helix-turn-helix transcriptional regulator [Thermoguttaceae bacterium]